MTLEFPQRRRFGVIHRMTAAIAFAIFAVPTLALAQDRGSEKDQEACTPDVFRLCQEFIPNEAPIVACLKAKHAELSTACSLVMYPAPTAADTTATIKPRATTRHAGSTHSHKKRKHAVKSAG
jgi:hypothetical protein